MRKLIYIAAAFVAGCIAAGLLRRVENPEAEKTVETVYETVAVNLPVARESVVVRYATYRAVVTGDSSPGQKQITDSMVAERDSVAVEVPILQRHYADSMYEAWVSGPIDPRLDSVRLYAASTIVKEPIWKPPKRWHVGPTVGVGVTPHGVEPFIGISVTYSIISF